MIQNMLQILVPVAWTWFGVYAVWYFTSAKRYAPLTRGEARALWHIHKHNVRCDAKKCKEIRRGGKIIGFECGCGYKHFQERPIVGNGPASSIKLKSPDSSALESLHTTYKAK